MESTPANEAKSAGESQSNKPIIIAAVAGVCGLVTLTIGAGAGISLLTQNQTVEFEEAFANAGEISRDLNALSSTY